MVAKLDGGIELVKVPCCTDVTLSVIVQTWLGAREPPLKLKLLAPGMALTTPPGQFADTMGLGTENTIIPAGILSTNLKLVREIPEGGFSMSIFSTVGVPPSTVDGLKDLPTIRS